MEILIHLLKSAAILSLFLVIYRFLLNKDTLFTARRAYLLSGIIVAILLPFLTFEQINYIVIPAAQQIEYASMDPALFTAPVTSYIDITPTSQVNWIHVILITYLIGVSVMVTRFLYQLFTLNNLIKSGVVVSKEDTIFIEVSAQVTPFSFFKYIVYNKQSHQLEDLAMILAHERVHARQWHSIDVLIMQIILCVQWCNPMAWLYKNDINENLEFIADHHAVQQLPSVKDYQRALVKASSALQPALTTNFYQSFIKKRILMLNKPKSRKQNLWKLGLILPVLAVFMYSFQVKEVLEYVEEETTETPLEKAVSTTDFSFKITQETTKEEFAYIEAYFDKTFVNTKIKFSKVTHTDGKLRSFDFTTKMGANDKYIRTFSVKSDHYTFNDYTIIPIIENEIHILHGYNKTIVSDTEHSTVNRFQNTETMGDNPILVINGNIIEGFDNDLAGLDTDNSITTYYPTKAVQLYGLIAADGAYTIDDPNYTTKINGKYPSSPKQFIFTVSSTSKKFDLDRIENVIATDFPNSKIRFSKRKYYKNGTIKRFAIQTKFDGDATYHTRFERKSDIKTGWKGYAFEITLQDEIIVQELDKGGTSFKIDIDKISFLTDLPATVFDRALVTNKYDTKNKGTYKRSSQDQPIAFTDYIQENQTSVLSQDTYSFRITKNSTPEELDLLQQTLKEKHGARLTIKNVDYNEMQEIISIHIDFKDASGNNKNYTIQSSSPIADIYIYRDANGRTGMGNAASASDASTQVKAMRDQMKTRQGLNDSILINLAEQRQAQREQMEAGKNEIRTRMEQTRSLQGLAAVDSLRSQLRQNRDSMRMQKKSRRDTLRQIRGFTTATGKKANVGYKEYNGDTYYYAKKKNGRTAYYTRWGVEVQENDPIYKELVNAPNISEDDTSKKKINNLLQQYTASGQASFDNAIYYLNGKKITLTEFKNLDPDTIESVSILKGKTAVRLYGQEAANGAILIETKN